MKLGAFSVSLAVKDIQKSFEFYSKLGFEPFGGDIEQKWLILKSGETLIGLFEGLFKGNLLTFNPGWDQNAENTEYFDDVRKIETACIEGGLVEKSSIEKGSQGPASFSIIDPDGNVILIDQHR